MEVETLFDSFSLAARKIIDEWDVLNRAVEESWGEYDPIRCSKLMLLLFHFVEERIIIDLLESFKEKWKSKSKVGAEQINSFLVDIFDEFFDADISDTAVSLSKVLQVLFDECLCGVSTGVQAVIARTPVVADTSRDVVIEKCEDDSSDEEDKMEVEDLAREKPKIKTQPVTDADGWTTVTKR